ncbi:MAG TPA: transcriptional repressor [Candidatus Brocadiia bacterium]|nr:transcriptional repressor [Candidatus Brocadiia bacterium]
MKHESPEIRERLEHLKKALQNAGIKMTPQRMEVFREVARSTEHPDAEAIFKKVRHKLPSISLDTVYRNLWLLIDLGMVTDLGPPGDRARFDGNIKPHHHFVCSKCGAVRDFYNRDFDNLEIPNDVKKFGAVQRTVVEFRGLCSRCYGK